MLKKRSVRQALIFGLLLFSPTTFGEEALPAAEALVETLYQIQHLVLECNFGDINLPPNIPGTPNFNPLKCDNDPSRPKKGVDPQFLDILYKIRFEPLAFSSPVDPSARYRVTLFQFPALDGPERKLEIDTNGLGKILAIRTLQGGEPENAPLWLDEDPGKLFEMALNFITKMSNVNSILEPYQKGLTQLSIAPETDSEDELFARVTVEITSSDPTLQILLDLTGEVQKYEIIPKP